MGAISRDTGVMTALLQRLVNERLPRALALQEKVERGEALGDFDIAFLERALADCKDVEPIVRRNPQYADIAAHMVHLYKEITAKALANERAQNGPQK